MFIQEPHFNHQREKYTKCLKYQLKRSPPPDEDDDDDNRIKD